MTPLQFAKLECAKFNGCACVLGNGDTCQYFEDCVLPMVKWFRGPNAKKYTEAAKIYQAVNKAGELI
jgi:hypothetical protein